MLGWSGGNDCEVLLTQFLKNITHPLATAIALSVAALKDGPRPKEECSTPRTSADSAIHIRSVDSIGDRIVYRRSYHCIIVIEKRIHNNRSLVLSVPV